MTPCPSCGTAADGAFVVRDRNLGTSRERFVYLRCPRCGLVFQPSPPSDLGRFYPAHYHAAPSAFEALVTAESWKVKLVEDLAPGRRMMEIGPGVGAFAVAASRAGFSVSTIDADPEAVDRLRDVHGIPSVCSDKPHSLLAPNGDLDAVVAWHVVEHLPHPSELVKAAAASLATGGVLILATPNPDALGFRVLGARWPHVDAPRHLQLLPSRLLVEVGQDCGLEEVSCTTDDEGARHWNAFGWRRALAPSGSSTLRRGSASLAGPALTVIAAPIERRRGNGSSYTLVLRKT